MNYVPVISIYCHKAKQSYYIKVFLSINSYDVLFSFLFSDKLLGQKICQTNTQWGNIFLKLKQEECQYLRSFKRILHNSYFKILLLLHHHNGETSCWLRVPVSCRACQENVICVVNFSFIFLFGGRGVLIQSLKELGVRRFCIKRTCQQSTELYRMSVRGQYFRRYSCKCICDFYAVVTSTFNRSQEQPDSRLHIPETII